MFSVCCHDCKLIRSTLCAGIFCETDTLSPRAFNSGSSFGDGDSFDGDGVGENTADEVNYPYN